MYVSIPSVTATLTVELFFLLFKKTVIIPGDNDIGGEGADLRTPFKVARFEKHFEPIEGVVNHLFIDFMKVKVFIKSL